MKKTPEDYMRLALELAAKGRYSTSPNPRVGAVVVKTGKIVGQGWHHKPGTPHAEPLALAEAGRQARGATLFVTLEPCTHQGRTPPCCPAIKAAGIAEVWVADVDPDPRVSGKGIAWLRAHGLEVHVGLLCLEAAKLNEKYLKHRRMELPFITLKAALTLDGKIASRTGDSKWITSPEARRAGHLLRAEHDAVLVGVGTVVADDPQLTCRVEGVGEFSQPVRLVIDPQLRAPLEARVFSATDRVRRMVLCSEEAPQARMVAFQHAGVELLPLARREDGRLALEPALRQLASEGTSSILVEGGGETHAALLAQGYGDKIWFVIAPKLLGGRNAPTPVEGEGAARVAEALNLEQLETSRVGCDILCQGYLFGRQPECSQGL